MKLLMKGINTSLMRILHPLLQSGYKWQNKLVKSFLIIISFVIIIIIPAKTALVN